MTITKIGFKWYKISLRIDYWTTVEERYMYYTQREAIALFKKKYSV